MPRGDGTGPLGQGPRMGRGAGFGGQGRGGRRGAQRAAAEVPGDASAAASPESPPQSELQWLQTQVAAAAATLDQIRQRLDELAAERIPLVSRGDAPAGPEA